MTEKKRLKKIRRSKRIKKMSNMTRNGNNKMGWGKSIKEKINAQYKGKKRNLYADD